MPDRRPSIPLVDLLWQTNIIREEVQKRFGDVMDASDFVLGSPVADFEAEFAEYCGVSDCIGVGNGTDALELCLSAAGVGAGDEVIIPANTFAATAEAVVRVGASIVLADCSDDFLIDPSDVSVRQTARTRAVLAVHLYGQAAPVERIRQAVGPDVLIIEDAAQAQGARRNGVSAGGLGDLAATSFYPGKNLGAFGDGGAVMTNDREAAKMVRALRNHGGIRKYEHSVVGRNSRLDAMQAVVLSAKLHYLDEWNSHRRLAASWYEAELAGLEGCDLPPTLLGNDHVYHLYVVRVPRRDHILSELSNRGISAGIHYPTPIHRLPAYSFLGHASGDFPRAEQLSSEVLSLPMFPGITHAQVEAVCRVLVGRSA